MFSDASLRDEERIVDYAVAYGFSLSLTILMAAVVAFPHEFFHAVGAVFAGGTIESIEWFNVGNWFQAFIYPVTPSAGEIGSVTAAVPQSTGSLFVFALLPYLVLFPVSFVLLLGDNVGLPNWGRLIGGPVFIHSFAAFWTDLGVFLQAGGPVYPLPQPIFFVLYRFLYLAVIVGGVMATTFYYGAVRD